MRRFCIILAVAVLAVPLVGESNAAPEPSLALKTWQLDFEFHDPARISVTLPGKDKPTSYWFLLFTVTNNTGREIEFYPTFQLVTDTLDIVDGNEEISPSVYRAIRERYNKLYPFLVDPTRMYGTLRQGEDNRRTGVVAFRSFDPDADALTVYVSGLSGELSRVRNPAYEPLKVESDKNRPFFVLRKTLAVRYNLPGDRESRRLTDPIRVKREWVMR